MPMWSWFLEVYLSFLKLYLSLWPPDSWTCASHVGRLVRSWKHTYCCGDGFCKFTYCRLGVYPKNSGRRPGATHISKHQAATTAGTPPRSEPLPQQARIHSRSRVTRRYTHLQEPTTRVGTLLRTRQANAMHTYTNQMATTCSIWKFPLGCFTYHRGCLALGSACRVWSPVLGSVPTAVSAAVFLGSVMQSLGSVPTVVVCCGHGSVVFAHHCSQNAWKFSLELWSWFLGVRQLSSWKFRLPSCPSSSWKCM